MLDRFKVYPSLDHCLGMLKQNRRLAVAMSREYVKNNHQISTSQIHCFENTEIIYEYALTFLVHENFPYLTELNTFIRRASAGGLIEKWRNSHSKRTLHKRNERIYSELKVQNFQGVFSLVLVFIMTQCSVLMLERFIHKKANAKNTFRAYKMIQMVIDPDRHFLLENKMI